MARSHTGPDLYRAVVRVSYPERTGFDGKVYPAYTRIENIGPYPQRGTAAAQVTRQKNYFTGSRHDITVTGHVEKAVVTWEPVP